jgi:hypothetical protein
MVSLPLPCFRRPAYSSPQAQTDDQVMKNGDVSAEITELDIETRKYVPQYFINSRQIGQMFLIGFQGATVSPEIRHLIEHYYIGCVIFARRNITGTLQSTRLT